MNIRKEVSFPLSSQGMALAILYLDILLQMKLF